MVEKMAKFLKELYSNLGLPDGVLKTVAPLAVIGLKEDATDDEIKARAKEESVSAMLKSFQSHADKRASDAKKDAEKDNKGDDVTKSDDKKKDENNDQRPSWLAELLDSQKKVNDSLIKRLEAIEQVNATKSFDEKVATFAKEYRLSGAMLDLVKAGLSSDMSDDDIKNKLGQAAKLLADSGAHLGGSSTMEQNDIEAQEKRWREEEVEWAKRQARIQAQQQSQE